MPAAHGKMKRRLRVCVTGGEFSAMTQPAGTPHLTLVVPCYNGEDRLPPALAQLSAFLAMQPYSSELVLVDDCSAEPAARILRDYAAGRPGITLIRNEVNLGKGKRLTADYQFVADPGFNAARGPVSIYAGRLHAEF